MANKSHTRAQVLEVWKSYKRQDQENLPREVVLWPSMGGRDPLQFLVSPFPYLCGLDIIQFLFSSVHEIVACNVTVNPASLQVSVSRCLTLPIKHA